MKKIDRISASLLLQSLFVFVIILGFFGILDNDLMFGVGVFLLFIQCLDAYDLYPSFKAIIRYFLLSVFFVVIGAIVLNVVTFGLDLVADSGSYNTLFGFLYGFLMVICFVLIIISFLFIPIYYLGTLFYRIHLGVKPVPDKVKIDWEETEILDDNLLNTAI